MLSSDEKSTALHIAEDLVLSLRAVAPSVSAGHTSSRVMLSCGEINFAASNNQLLANPA